jgi:hypothetical protein
MKPIQSIEFGDKFRKGHKLILDLDDPLSSMSFPSRALEINAIKKWAYENEISLNQEFYLEQPNNSLPAHVVMYAYNAEPKKEETRYTVPKKVQTLETTSITSPF